jgi:hypothetical protein
MFRFETLIGTDGARISGTKRDGAIEQRRASALHGGAARRALHGGAARRRFTSALHDGAA